MVGSVPLGLEPLCFGVPIIDGGRDRIHRINMAHKHRVESFQKEADENCLVSYSTEVDSDFKLIDVSKHIIFVLDKGL